MFKKIKDFNLRYVLDLRSIQKCTLGVVIYLGNI